MYCKLVTLSIIFYKIVLEVIFLCRFVNLNASKDGVSEDTFKFCLNFIWCTDKENKCNINKNTIYGYNAPIQNVESVYNNGFRALKLKDNLEINKASIEKLNDYNFVLDVSEISDCELEIIKLYSKLPIITIGNSFTLYENKTNINDERLRAIKLLDGVVGINIQKELLNSDRSREKSYDSLFEHITYMLSVIGSNNIGIAINFNGETILPWELQKLNDIRVLEHWLDVYYGKQIKEKIMYRNMIRVLNREKIVY